MNSFLEAYETPRLFHLAPNLIAASFALMKLMPARLMLDRAEQEGALDKGARIIESSSGSLGLALAMLAAERNYPLTLVTASSLIDLPFAARIRQLGAELIVNEDPSASGDQWGRLSIIEKLIAERPGTYWPRQYDNPDNPASYARLAELLVRANGQIDCLVGTVGSGGSLCGTAGFLRSVFPDLHVIAVDTNRSALFGHRPGARLLRGLGNSLVPANLRHNEIDEVHWIGAFQAFMATRHLNTMFGAYLGPTSGAAALVAQWYASRNPTASTAVILPDEGGRYQQTVYNDEWLSSLAGWPVCELRSPQKLDRPQEHGEGSWTMLDWQRRMLVNKMAEATKDDLSRNIAKPPRSTQTGRGD